MKKSLLSLLAVAVATVGCQNYDDQFDDLNSQIAALSSQVAGLAQVQNDLASLSATVGSLQSAISGEVEAALSDGLAGIDAAVAELEAAADSAASAEDVAAIGEQVDANNTALEELLAQSSVFQGNVVVSTPATLDAYHSMGDGLQIVNGYVDIDVSSDMDILKVQELVDFIRVTTGDFAYTAGTSVDTEVTFNNLTGTQSLTLDQEGGYVLQALESATKLTLDDDSSVDVVDLRSLVSVTSLSDGSGAGTFTFAKATELHLTALPRYNPLTLSLGVDEEGVIDITALTDTNASGEDTKLILSLDGADVNITNISGDKAGSQITVSNAINATFTGYDGKVVIGDDVQNFTSDGLVSLSITGDDLVTFTATGLLDPNATTADTEGPAISISSNGDLETVTLDGNLDSVSLDSNGNMTGVSISATVVGAAGISITNNSDLTDVTLTGATTDKVAITGNSDLEELTVDFTADKGKATTQEGTIHVKSNESLTSLVISTNFIDNLDITNNADLETIDLSGLTKLGATSTASVTIQNNDLNAEKSDNLDDGTTNVDDGKAGDLGSFTTDSGLDTAKEYLTAVVGDDDSKAVVKFDTVDSVVSNEGATEVETATDATDVAVLTLTPTVTNVPGQAAAKAKFSTLLTTPTAGEVVSVWANGVEIVPEVTLGANNGVNAANIASTSNISTASGAGVTLSASANASAEVIVEFMTDGAAASEISSTGPNVAAAGVLTASDLLTITLGTGESVQVSGTTTADIDAVLGKISGAWTTKYPAASASVVRWTLVSDPGNDKIIFQAKDRGSAPIGTTLVVAHTANNGATSVSRTTSNLGWRIGNPNNMTISSSDNIAQGTAIMITLEAKTAGDLLSEIGTTSDTQAATVKAFKISTDASTHFLTTSYNPNVTASSNEVTATQLFVSESRADVTIPDEALAADTTAGSTFNRVSWL